MIIKIYDDNNVFQGVYFDTLKDYKIIQEYNKADNCEFEIPLSKENLNRFRLEYYIEDENSIYCIKEIELDGNDYIHVYAVGDVEEFETIAATAQIFNNRPGTGLANIVNANTSWTVENHSNNNTLIDSIIWLDTPISTIISNVREAYALWFKYDTKNQVLHIYDEVANAVSQHYYSNELYLESLTVSADTYQLCTAIQPRGGKDLAVTISSLNNLNPMLYDYSYTDKYIFRYYDRTDIDNVEILLRASRAFLRQVSRPQERYQVKLLALKGAKIGDTITVVDNIKRIKTDLKVIKIVKYPQEPEKSTVDVGNRWVDFSKQFMLVSQEVFPSGSNLL